MNRSKNLKTISKIYKNTYCIKKSKFIGLLLPITSKEDVLDKIEKYNIEYHNSTHICYAYRLFKGQEIIEDFCDANEPKKSAGYPLLLLLQNTQLMNILAISIRYYGGIKLGIGRLSRSYVKSISQIIDENNFMDLHYVKYFSILVNYCNKFIVYKLKNLEFIRRIIITYPENKNCIELLIYIRHQDESKLIEILNKYHLSEKDLKFIDSLYI